MIHFFHGYIQVRLISESSERFLNACCNQKIYLWGVISETTGCTFNMYTKDFKKIKNILRTTHSKIQILEKNGFPFMMNHYKKHQLFVAGALVCLILIFIFSNILWSIQITGNQTCTTETLLKYLEDENIRIGIPIRKINCSEIAANIRRQYDEIIWVSASIEGTYLKLNIKENASNKSTTSQNPPPSKAMDLIADSDCIIKKIVTRSGIPQVKPGDYVKKGSILISGQIPVYNDAKEIISYKNCVADADITGESILNYYDIILYSHKNKIPYKDIFKKEYFIKVKNKLYTLGTLNNRYTNNYLYSIQKNFHDFSFGVRIIKPYHYKNQNYDITEIQEILTNRFNNYCKELEKKGVVILQNDVKIYTWHEEASASGQITIQKSLGIKRQSTKKSIQLGEQINGNDGSNH